MMETNPVFGPYDTRPPFERSALNLSKGHTAPEERRSLVEAATLGLRFVMSIVYILSGGLDAAD
jgi:hypothetical protein